MPRISKSVERTLQAATPDLMDRQPKQAQGMECTHPALGAATAVTRRRYYGTIVVARDEMEDSEGANLVTDPVDVAGNVIVVELETGHFVVLGVCAAEPCGGYLWW